MVKRNDYTPMQCPVCGEFYFSELQDYEFDALDYIQCTHCGWKYDVKQHDDPELKAGENEMSLSEYREWYKQQIAENPDFDYIDATYEPTPHKCPVCGKHTFSDESSFEICPYCGWQDDGSDENDSDILGPNELKYSDFKARYERLISANPHYKWNKDK